jgi:putative ABC transport system permease protein
MYIITRGPNGMMEGIKTRFKGIVKSMPLFADHVAFVRLSKIQELLGWRSEDCSTVKVMLEDKEMAQEIAGWLKQSFKNNGIDLEVKTWKQLGGFYYHIALLGRVLVFFLLIILAAITAISVSNTMLMSVKERTREIGTMMAMGMRRKEIILLFLLESFSLSLLSAFGGAIFGSVATLWFQHRGIVEGLALVLEGRLYPMLGFYPVLLSFLWILIIGTLGGLYPAYKAANLDPIEALRYA